MRSQTVAGRAEGETGKGACGADEEGLADAGDCAANVILCAHVGQIQIAAPVVERYSPL